MCTAVIADRRPVLVTPAIEVLYDQWDAARRDWQVRILAYVVMPDHFHAVLWATEGRRIHKFLQRILTLTSRQITGGGGLWRERPRLLPLHSPTVLKAKVDYIHRNPLRRGLAVNPEEWEHSSFQQLVLGTNARLLVCDSWDAILP